MRHAWPTLLRLAATWQPTPQLAKRSQLFLAVQDLFTCLEPPSECLDCKSKAENAQQDCLFGYVNTHVRPTHVQTPICYMFRRRTKAKNAQEAHKAIQLTDVRWQPDALAARTFDNVDCFLSLFQSMNQT